MGTVTGTFKGKEFTYEKSTQEAIYNNLKTMNAFDIDEFEAANPDVNLLDIAALLAGYVYKAPSEKIKLMINGLTIVLDGTTNAVSNQ